jgi:hypothetical protein
MMIGGSSGIPFAVFFVTLAPVALFGFIVAISLLPRFHRDEFSNPRQAHRIECPIPFDRLLLIKSSLASAILFGSFFAGAPIAVAALIAGATLLVTRRVYPEEVYAQIDGSLLVMFSGRPGRSGKRRSTKSCSALPPGITWNKIPVLSFVSVLLSILSPTCFPSCHLIFSSNSFRTLAKHGSHYPYRPP